MKKIKEFYHKVSEKFYLFVKESGWLILFTVGMTLWIVGTLAIASDRHKRETYDVECYSGINQIYKANKVKLTWTGFNNIEVSEKYQKKKIYGDCVLVLNEEK
tara:strand:- start:745 stop:1053 length:309 start_codon:yes stop_codon:yes gene_type:complete